MLLAIKKNPNTLSRSCLALSTFFFLTLHCSWETATLHLFSRKPSRKSKALQTTCLPNWANILQTSSNCIADRCTLPSRPCHLHSGQGWTTCKYAGGDVGGDRMRGSQGWQCGSSCFLICEMEIIITAPVSHMWRQNEKSTRQNKKHYSNADTFRFFDCSLN